MGVEEVVEEVVPYALWDQIGSEGGTGADSGSEIACGEFGLDAAVGTAGGDARAETVDGRFGWRTGHYAVTDGAGVGAGRWCGWVGEVGEVEKLRAVAVVYVAAEEDE